MESSWTIFFCPIHQIKFDIKHNIEEAHMQGQDFTKYLEPLEGMTYREWVKLKYLIDTEFHKKEYELQNELKLVNAKDLTL